jgi:ligand-binding SRPBCC domain-containing protein
MPVFEQAVTLPVSATRAFAYLCHPQAFNRLNPPWEKVDIIHKTGGVEDGATQDMRVQLAPGIWTRWLARHQDYIPGVQFADKQVTGPFARWLHTHRVQAVDVSNSLQTDHIDYALPFDWLTGPVGYWVVKQKLARMFAYRHQLMAIDLALPDISGKVLVSGHVPHRQALMALLAIKGATLCQYADEQPQLALLAPGELAGRNLQHSLCIDVDQLPPLPTDHPVLAAKTALASAWPQQCFLYQGLYWVHQQLTNQAQGY